MKLGLSLKEWEQSFDATLEEREVLARHAQNLLNDELFQRLLSSMECQSVQAWNQLPIEDEDNLRKVKRQLEAVKLMRRTVTALAQHAKVAKKHATD